MLALVLSGGTDNCFVAFNTFLCPSSNTLYTSSPLSSFAHTAVGMKSRDEWYMSSFNNIIFTTSN